MAGAYKRKMKHAVKSSLMLEQEHVNFLDKDAHYQNKSRADIIREAITDYIEERRKYYSSVTTINLLEVFTTKGKQGDKHGKK